MSEATAQPAFDALSARRSHSKFTDEAPSDAEIGRLLGPMTSIADHSRLRPWRIVLLRGDARLRLGRGLAKATGSDSQKTIAKATRAPLVLAIVASPRKSKVPVWEQETVASGVAHALELLLHESGWGCFWRTGHETRSKALRKVHKLKKHEYLLGWLYVGGVPDRDRKIKPRKPLDLARHLTVL